MKRDSVTNRMDIDGLQFSKRDNEKLVTDANANETIANIELSRCHALNPPSAHDWRKPRKDCRQSIYTKLARQAGQIFTCLPKICAPQIEQRNL